MESVIENLDKGIMIVDKEGKIVNINKFGVEIFNKDKDVLLKEYINYIFFNLENILFKLDENKSIIIKEVKFKYISIYKIKLVFKVIKYKEKIIGMVVIMRNEKEEIDVKDIIGVFLMFNDIIGESVVIINVIINCKIIFNSFFMVLI